MTRIMNWLGWYEWWSIEAPNSTRPDAATAWLVYGLYGLKSAADRHRIELANAYPSYMNTRIRKFWLRVKP